MSQNKKSIVSIVMGSQSDYKTMKLSVKVLKSLKINHELKNYLEKISDQALYAYNVYQIEGEGKTLFSKIEGDENTIMGLPVKKIKEYLNNYK